MIDFFIPVLHRPERAAPLFDSIERHVGCDFEVWFLCSEGDREQIEASAATGAHVLIDDLGETVGSQYPRKMNQAFLASRNPWIFLGSDDIEFTPGWSETALAEKAEVIATNDEANAQVKRGEFGTHCLVSRRYVTNHGGSADGPGVLMHEGYDHNFVDRELCCLARYRRTYAFARGSVVRHSHPHWRTASWDDTYRKGLKNFHVDRDLFITRAHMWGYMGLSSSERNLARRRYRDIVRAK